jgi:GTP-binding protein
MVVTKLDLAEVRERWPELRAALRAAGHEPIGVSAQDGTGLDALRAALAAALDEAEREAVVEAASGDVLVHTFDPLEEGWEVLVEPDGLRVRGRRIEQAANRTNFENDESRERFGRLLARLGIEGELERLGAQPGTTVRIGRAELEWGDEE